MELFIFVNKNITKNIDQFTLGTTWKALKQLFV